MSQTVPPNEAITTTPTAQPEHVTSLPAPDVQTVRSGGSGLYGLLSLLSSDAKEEDSEREEVESSIRKERKQAGVARRILLTLASLRLTVILLAMSLVVVFCGTLALKDTALLRVVHDYFRSIIIWIPFRIFFPTEPDPAKRIGGSFPYPGGWTLGSLLLVNVLAAHAVRFRYTFKRVGVVLIHAGIILLMVGELGTRLFAVESFMSIPDGRMTNFTIRSDRNELAVLSPGENNTTHQVVVPQSFLTPEKGRIQDDRLPFDVEVISLMPNSDMKNVEAGTGDNPATAGIGSKFRAEQIPEIAGSKEGENRPALYAKLYHKGAAAPFATYLFSTHWAGQKIAAGGKVYDVSLRPEREYKPYKVQLLEFNHDVYIGTKTARNFSSRVRLIDPTTGVDREAVISMNQPLTYEKESFYQHQFQPGDTGTVLQVVRNPSRAIPYISCTLVSLGMIVHFGAYLVGFLQRRRA